MSVSAHLTPEPERRLWLILESLRREVEWSETRIAAATAFAAAELAWLGIPPGAGPLRAIAVGALAAALPLGVLALAPLPALPRWLSFLEPPKGRPSVNDSLIASEDLAKYAHGELIHRLDKYLGGGITATPYYEDLVGQIAAQGKAAARQQRLLRISCLLLALGQLCLLALLAARAGAAG